MTFTEKILNTSKAEARNYQIRLIDKVTGYFNDGIRSAIINSPPGSGKTVIGLAIAKALQMEHNIGIGWVAMRRTLLTQGAVTNRDLEIGVEDIRFISMFNKTPPTEDNIGRPISLLVVDECLPGDSVLHIIQNNQPRMATIREVVDDVAGTHVLSQDASGASSYKTITNRTPMGKKQILEITLNTREGIFLLHITENGRVFADGQYRRVNELQIGMVASCLASCSQTYLYERNTTQCETEIRKDPKGKDQKCPKMRVRMWPKDTVVPLYQEVQKIQVQSPSEACQRNQNHPTSNANYQRDSIGRRQLIANQKSHQRCKANKGKIENTTLSTKTKRIHILVAPRTGLTLLSQCQDQPQQRFWERDCSICNTIAPSTVANLGRTLHSTKNSQHNLPKHYRRSRTGRLVDGRRLSKLIRYTRVFQEGEPANCRLVKESLEHHNLYRLGQACQKAIHQNETTQLQPTAQDNIPACPSESLVQIPALPAKATISGTIISIRTTNRIVETYDIGVAENRNFYADGILVHNCQHDAANSMVNIHNQIMPRWILGLTATPYRTDRMRLCFDKVVRDIGIHQLIQKNYLSQYHQYTIPEWTVDTVCNTYLREPERWGKSVIYWHKRENAIECMSKLQKAGIRVATIFGNQPMAMREERLKKFEDGEIDVLINMMLLAEGWDLPALKTVFVRDSQKGPTIQMAGRIFRKYPGIKYKQIVQSKSTRYPIHREAQPAESLVWMKNSWRSYVRSPAIERVARKALLSIAHITTEMPDFITKKKIRHLRRF